MSLPLKKNQYREAVAEGRPPIGHMVWEFGSRGIAKLLDSVGVDFVIFDMEHSGFGHEKICDLLAWSKASAFAPFVRIPQTEYHFLARAMDAGAMGVMVPNVQTVEQAQKVVDSVKYAPAGKRGVAFGCAHTDYLAPGFRQFFDAVNDSSVVICQIESEEGVRNVEAIAALPGVDNLWVGQADLSTSLGIPGEYQNPKFTSAVRHVAEVAKKNGKLTGILPNTAEQARQWIDLGCNCIAWSVDSLVYQAAITQSVADLKKMFS